MTNADDLPKPDRDPLVKGASHSRWFSEKWLAVLLLRLLGIYLVGCASVSGLKATEFFLAAWPWLRDDGLLVWAEALSVAKTAAELIIGIYFVVGGRWAFGRILVPIARRRHRADEAY